MTEEIKNEKITGILSVPGSDSGERWTPEWDVLFTDPGHVGFVDPQTGEHWRISLQGEEASALGSLLMRMTSELGKAREHRSKIDTVMKAVDNVVQTKEIENLRDQIAHDREGMLALRRKYGSFKDETVEQWIARLYGEAQLHREEEIRQINGWAHGETLTDETVELARGIAQQINLLEERLVKVENQEGPFRLMVTGVSGIPPNGLTELVASLCFAPAGSWLEIERSAPIVGDPAALEGHLSRMLNKYSMKETSRPVTVAEMDRLKPDWRTARWRTDNQADPELGVRLNPGGLPPTVPQEEPESQQQPVPPGCGTDQGDPDPEGNRPGVVKLGADGLPVDLQAEAIREVLQHNSRFDRWTSVACPACDRMTLGATRSAGMIPRITLKCSNCGFQVDI